MKADEGIIELTDLDTPSRPADLVVIDRRRPPAAGGDSLSHDPPRPAPLPVKFVADLDLDFGESFVVVSGSGVDAKLRGAIKLSGELPGSPRANGTVALRQGKYRAYGQVLDITRGRLIFNGPLDNTAARHRRDARTQTVDAGVALSGTTQAPRVRLVSNPESDAEKLSWLVLGTGLEDARTGSQTAALQAAAATLFGTGDGGPGFSQRLGLDSFGLGARDRHAVGAAQAPTMRAGCRRSRQHRDAGGGLGRRAAERGHRRQAAERPALSQLRPGPERRVEPAEDPVCEHQPPLFSIRALTGSESAVDLLFFHSFD